MEKYFLKDDLKLICVAAKSFPDGVTESFERLGKILPSKNGRNLFGISFPGKDGKIIYKAAAAEAFDCEAAKLGCESFTVKKGTYNNIYISDFMKDIPSIGHAFKNLLDDPLIDPNGCCVEMYLNEKDVRCMVRLDPEKILNEDKIFELENTLKEFYELSSPLNEEQLNMEFPDGSWTAGQLVRHVIKVNSGFLRQLNGHVEDTKRNYDEFAENIKTSFLSFNVKMKSPDFVVPEKRDYKKDELLGSLKEINSGFIEAAKSLDMTKTCITFEVPVLGYLTRYEIIYFVIYHTQRHIHFLKKRIQSLNY